MPETLLTELALYSARPTIRVDTQEYPVISDSLVAMEMIEQEGGLSSLELRVSNIASEPDGGADFTFENNEILKLGARIAIYSGDVAEPREIFQGMIMALEGDYREGAPPELVILAEDAFQQARMARRTKVHDNVTLADLAQALATQIGLTLTITGFADNIGTQVQLNESDLAFLRRLLARYDGDLQVVGNELHLSPRKDVSRGSLELELHSQLRHARVIADLAHQVTEITATGWDVAQGQRVTVSSRGANPGPGSGSTGAQLLSSAVGERAEHLGHLAMTNSTEAQALADAAFDQRARKFVCMQGTAEGNPSLRIGTNLRLRGLGPRFDNTYYVTWACHRFDLMRGYETHFKAECSYWGGV